jgi:hypothetical protein
VTDIAAEFIKRRGAATVSELAVYLSAAGVNVRGDNEFAGEELAYLWRKRQEVPALPVIASGSTAFVRTIAALLVNRTVDLGCHQPRLALAKRAGTHPMVSHPTAPTTGAHSGGRPANST